MGEASNKVLGKTKKAVGQATGDKHLETDGRMQETTGKMQGGVRKVSGKVEDSLDAMGRKMREKRQAGARPERQRNDDY